MQTAPAMQSTRPAVGGTVHANPAAQDTEVPVTVQPGPGQALAVTPPSPAGAAPPPQPTTDTAAHIPRARSIQCMVHLSTKKRRPLDFWSRRGPPPTVHDARQFPAVARCC